MNDEMEGRLHYRSDVVEHMTSLLSIWQSPRFQRDIVTERNRALSTLEVRVLWTLGSLGPSRPSDLSAGLDATATSVSKATAKLADAGLVVREPSPNDLRSHTLRLSAEGLRAAQELYDVGDAMVTEILADWSEQDVAQLRVLLARFVSESETYARRIHHDAAAQTRGSSAD